MSIKDFFFQVRNKHKPHYHEKPPDISNAWPQIHELEQEAKEHALIAEQLILKSQLMERSD